jgi:hypothetical protein
MLFRVRVSDPSLAESPSIEDSTLQDDVRATVQQQLVDLANRFERFFSEQVVPNMEKGLTRVGKVDSVALAIAGHTAKNECEYFLLIGGIMFGSGGAIELIQKQFDVQIDQLGKCSEVGQWQFPDD